MKEIIPGLFLGSLEDIHDVENISKNGVSHILTVDSTSLPAKLQDEFIHKGISLDHVYMLDTLDFELCSALQNALQILNSRSSSCISVVHCFAGVSRSASVIICYLMKRLDISYDRAYHIVKEKKSDISPNPNFERQLRLFEKQGKNFENLSQFRIPKLQWNLKCQNRGKAQNDQDDTTLITAKCKKCRYRIIDACTLIHGDFNSDKCSSIFLEEPQPWLLEDGMCVQDTKISCPVCKSKLGLIRWSGNMCSCQRWITPAIQFHRSKIDGIL